MIPGLLHGRLLGGGGGGGILAAPAYQTLTSSASGVSSASATATFTIEPDGTWTSSGSGSIDKSGNWFLPTTVGAGSAYEVRITPTLNGGTASVVTNGASGWVALSLVRQIQFLTQQFTAGTKTSSYSVKVEIRLTGGAIVSTSTFQFNSTVTVGGSGGGGGCPALDMWLGSALSAGEVQAGQKIDGVTADDPETKVRLTVLKDEINRQPCHRIVTSNGAACVLSDSTPFTLRDGSTRYTPDMLGQEVLRDDGLGGLVWDTVVVCQPMGERDVIKISVGGHSLLAGEHPQMRIVSHNYEKE